MATEIMLEKPMDGRDLPADTSAHGTEPTEKGPYHDHWASVIGAFKDDPTFDEMMKIIRQRRREMDADENII